MNGEIKISGQALRLMNHEQLDALQQQVIAQGCWENARKCYIIIETMGESIGPLLVSMEDGDDEQMILIGIERDGYVHS